MCDYVIAGRIEKLTKNNKLYGAGHKFQNCST
jgi:hypothetical protein